MTPIAVNDRLPEHDGRFLVYEATSQKWIIASRRDRDIDGDDWWIEAPYWWRPVITHWCELPPKPTDD